RRGEARLQIGGRVVRVVGIEQVHPQERGASRRRLLRPGERAGDDLLAAPFDRPVAIVARTAKPEACVVDVEAAVESWRRAVARIEDQRPEERRRSIASVAQELGEVRYGRR